MPTYIGQHWQFSNYFQSMCKEHGLHIRQSSCYEGTRLQYFSWMLRRSTSSGIYSQIPEKYSNGHTCICFVDYWISLLFFHDHDVTSHLQRLQNYAVQIILCIMMSAKVFSWLKSLRWLPVDVRCAYILPCSCYHYQCNTVPLYVTDMLR